MSLYDFQETAVEALRENIRAGVKNQMLCAPTGAGKTRMALHLISECRARGKRSIFVVDRTALLDQTSAAMDEQEIPHGVIAAKHWRWRPWERVQVASVQTIHRRQWPDADLLVIDEAHGQHVTVLKRIKARDTITVGLSATPFTRGLGKHYDAVVCVTTTQKLIEQKYLCPFRIFAASEPDMTGAKVTAGEWSDGEAEKRSMPIVGDCVAEYLKHGNDMKAIAFGCTVAHCEELQRQFLAAGVQAGLYTYQTPEDERTRLLAEFRKPDSSVRVLISVAALARGFDVPDVGVVILARPLRKSLAEHIQMLGRGLRRDPDNPAKSCVVLDHSGNCVRFWEPMSDFFENGIEALDDGAPKKKAKPARDEKQARKCPKCAHVHDPQPTCPHCGHEYPRKVLRHEAGELREIGSAADSALVRQRFYAELLWVSRVKGYRDGFAAQCYRNRYGTWPNKMHPEPIEASNATLKYVQTRMIAFWQAKKKEKATDKYRTRFAAL